MFPPTLAELSSDITPRGYGMSQDGPTPRETNLTPRIDPNYEKQIKAKAAANRAAQAQSNLDTLYKRLAKHTGFGKIGSKIKAFFRLQKNQNEICPKAISHFKSKKTFITNEDKRILEMVRDLCKKEDYEKALIHYLLKEPLEPDYDDLRAAYKVANPEQRQNLLAMMASGGKLSWWQKVKRALRRGGREVRGWFKYPIDTNKRNKYLKENFNFVSDQKNKPKANTIFLPYPNNDLDNIETQNERKP